MAVFDVGNISIRLDARRERLLAGRRGCDQQWKRGEQDGFAFHSALEIVALDGRRQYDEARSLDDCRKIWKNLKHCPPDFEHRQPGILWPMRPRLLEIPNGAVRHDGVAEG